jgi:hypothetical protein
MEKVGMRLKYKDMDTAIETVACRMLAEHSPEDIARLAATMLIRLTCYWTESPIDGSILIRGSMLADEELECNHAGDG